MKALREPPLSSSTRGGNADDVGGVSDDGGVLGAEAERFAAAALDELGSR